MGEVARGPRCLETFHDRMSRIAERIFPYIVPVAGVWLTYHYKVAFPANENGGDLLISAITMASIFMGFLVTAKSILLGLQTPQFRIIRNSPFFALLLKYLKAAIYCSLFYSCICLAGFFYTSDAVWKTPVWVYMTGVTILTFLRVFRVFMVLISYPPTE